MLEDFLVRLRRSVYRDEPLVRSSDEAPAGKVPKLIRAMRSLAQVSGSCWQPREEIFLKQARLMERYEDDFVFEGSVTRYYPTYESLTDRELRGYFTWRTQVRRGNMTAAPLTFAMLYAYEILHLIGCRDAQDGYEKLHSFCEAYRALDPQIGHYIVHWEDEFVIYYGLDSKLITWRGNALSYWEQDDAICTVLHRTEHTTEETMAAVCVLSSYRLERSKLYRAHTAEVNAVALRVLDRAAEYYEKHRQISFFDDLIAVEQTAPVRLFSSAVFQPPKEEPDRVYEVHPLRRYECVSGYWMLHSYERPERAAQRLGVFLRGVDAGLRAHFGITEIQPPKLKKWQAKIIDEEITAFLAEQRAAEARRVRLDFSQLARIRADADVTQERLIVEEEEEPPMMPIFEPSPVVSPSSSEDTLPAAPVMTEGAGDINGLDASELRLLSTLLADGDLAWVRTEGRMLSVLVDGINEKLYDDFADTVIEGDPPAVVPDYQDELIERYLHGCE